MSTPTPLQAPVRRTLTTASTLPFTPDQGALSCHYAIPTPYPHPGSERDVDAPIYESLPSSCSVWMDPSIVHGGVAAAYFQKIGRIDPYGLPTATPQG